MFCDEEAGWLAGSRGAQLEPEGDLLVLPFELVAAGLDFLDGVRTAAGGIHGSPCLCKSELLYKRKNERKTELGSLQLCQTLKIMKSLVGNGSSENLEIKTKPKAPQSRKTRQADVIASLDLEPGILSTD